MLNLGGTPAMYVENGTDRLSVRVHAITKHSRSESIRNLSLRRVRSNSLMHHPVFGQKFYYQ